MLLLCAWLGAARKASVTAADIEAFERIVRPWQESVLQSLRAARDAMKAMPEWAHEEVQSLRKQILAVELSAEQVEQALLFGAVSEQTRAKIREPVDAIVRGNLHALLQAKSPDFDLDRSGLSVDALIKAAVNADGAAQLTGMLGLQDKVC